MKRSVKSNQGIAWREILISIAIVSILTAIAIPSYKNYSRRAYYSEVVKAAAPYQLAVGECIKNLGTATGCDAGKNKIPGQITIAAGAVAALGVNGGVITITPVPSHGITASDTYVLTPSLGPTGAVNWASSGGGVTNGYVQ